MGTVLFEAAKILVYATASAAAVLLVGGAVKMVIEEDGETCVRKGLELAGTAIGATQLAGDTPRLPSLAS